MSATSWRVGLAALVIIPLSVSETVQVGQSTAAGTREVSRGGVQLTFLGVAGWLITDGSTVILVDPYLSAVSRPDGADPIRVPDSVRIDDHVRGADYIPVTHGHADHALDAAYIARTRGAIIIGHETVANIARAYDVPDRSLITVRGGDNYAFGSFSLRVIPSLHTGLRDKRYYNESLAGKGVALEEIAD